MAGRHHEGERAKVAAMLGAGVPLARIVSETGITRQTIWEWRTHDDEFRAMLAEIIDKSKAAAAKRLEGLAELSIDAFERGLLSTHRQQAMKVKGFSVDDDEITGEQIRVVELEDNSLAVKTADIVTRRIPELMPRQGIDVDLGPAEKLASLIRSLDADDAATRPDQGGPLPPPPGPPEVRADEPVDPDQA
jgi:hypothetical protein